MDAEYPYIDETQRQKHKLSFNQGRIVADVTIDGQPFCATIHTGFTRSFVNHRVAQLLGNNHKFLRDIDTNIYTDEGLCLRATKSLWANVCLDNRNVQFPLLVLPNICSDVILGLDFLCGIDARLQCGQTFIQLQPSLLTKSIMETNASELHRDPAEAKESTDFDNQEDLDHPISEDIQAIATLFRQEQQKDIPENSDLSKMDSPEEYIQELADLNDFLADQEKNTDDIDSDLVSISSEESTSSNTTEEWCEASKKWVVHTEGRLLPNSLVTELQSRLKANFRKNQCFCRTYLLTYHITINECNLITVRSNGSSLDNQYKPANMAPSETKKPKQLPRGKHWQKRRQHWNTLRAHRLEID